VFIPGLVKKYGDNKPINLEFNLDNVGNFSIREDDSTLSFDGSVSIKFWVVQDPYQNPNIETAIDVQVIQNHFNFTVDIP